MLDLEVMRIPSLVFIATISLLSGCNLLPNGSSMDYGEARKVSDSYTSDLVADHVGQALDKMELQAVQAAGGKAKAEAALRGLFDYCGRPLESELRHDDTGFSLAQMVEERPHAAFIILAELLNIRRVFASLL
jgi:hypothetical protein